MHSALTGLNKINLFLKLQNDIALDVIEKYGKGAGKLAGVFIGVLLVLLFLVGFILLGIEGFGNKTGFSAVINSLLPLEFLPLTRS